MYTSEIISLVVLLIVFYLERDKIFRRKRPVPISEYIADIQTEITPADPFLRFPCECKEQLELQQWIFPGQAAVLKCENCQLSWTVYNPTLVVKKTKELPEELQQVWAELSNEPQS